jgi:outer membrane lipoprotein SlyB
MRHAARLAATAVFVSLLAACASPAPKGSPVYSGSRPDAAAPSQYGRVTAIDPIGIPAEQPQGAGAVVGGIVGAIVGRQFGDSSHGKNTGTVVGAVGGALIGNEMEKNARRDGGGVRVSVQVDGAGLRKFDFREAGGLRVGDRVRIDGSQLYRL